MSPLFADVQKLLQICIFSLKNFRGCSLLFAWVAARLLHADPIPSAEPSYLHIYPILIHIALLTILIRVRNGPLPQSYWIKFRPSE
jgi:hypothetical protein